MKLLEENIGSMLLDISLSHIFLDTPPQARERKAKINKWNYLKRKLLQSKGNYQQNKKATY